MGLGHAARLKAATRVDLAWFPTWLLRFWLNYFGFERWSGLLGYVSFFFFFFGSVDRVSVALCLFRGLYIGWHCFYLFIVFLLSSFFQRLSIARGTEGMG